MATEDTKIVVSLETLIKGVPKAVKDLALIEKQLKSLTKVSPANAAQSRAIERQTQAQKRLEIASARLEAAQKRVEIANLRNATAAERARLSAQRAAQAAQKMAQQSAQAAQKLGQNADAHVRAFRALETQAKKAKLEVDRINSATARQAAEQVKIRERAAKSLARAEVVAAKHGANQLIDSLNKAKVKTEAVQGALVKVGNTLNRVGSSLQSFGRNLTIGLTAPLTAFAAISVKSAKDIDAIRNRLIATEGSVEAANKRLAELNRLADESVGVTRRSAQDAFSALSVIGGITEQTINRQIKALGRLNAAFTIEDQPQFFRNLVQIFSQGFERADVKEAIGRVPIFNQLLASAFGTSDPQKLRDLKAAGKLTLDTFLAGLAGAVESSPVLGQIRESIGTRLAKTFERLSFALAPLGDALLKPLERLITVAEPLILKLSEAFAALEPNLQTAVVAFGLLAAAAGPVLIVVGSIVTAIAALIPAITAIAGVIGTIGLPALLAILAGMAIQLTFLATNAVLLFKAWQTNFLGIRQIVADAANAVLQAFNRIKAIINEATERILPTLQSIVTKVVGGLTKLWEKYGKDVVRVVGTAFRFISQLFETHLKIFLDFVDAVVKLIDGDWRGAWLAFARIVITAIDASKAILQTLKELFVRAIFLLVDFLLDQAEKFAKAGKQLALRFVTELAAEIVAGAPRVGSAMKKMLLIAALAAVNSGAASVLVSAFIAKMRRDIAEELARLGPQVGVDVGSAEGLFAGRRTGASPPAPTGDAGEAATKALREGLKDLQQQQNELAEAEAQARIDLARQGVEQQFALTKDGLDRELDLLEKNFDQRLVAVKQYFQERQRLAEATIDAELEKERGLNGQLFEEWTERRRQINEQFKATVEEINRDPKLKGRARELQLQTAEKKRETELTKAQNDFENQSAEISTRILLLKQQRKRIGEDLLRDEKLLTEELRKQEDQLKFDLFDDEGRVADAAAGRLKAQFKATVDELRVDVKGLSPELQTALNDVDLTVLKTRLEQLPEPIRTLIQLLEIGIKRAQILESSRVVDSFQARLVFEEDKIQQQVLDGVISEREARKQIVELQKKYKGLLLDILAGELAKAKAIGDQDEITRIEAQIEGVKRLGVEIDLLGQQINQEIFSDLESGLANIFTSARRGIDGVKEAVIDLGFTILDTLSRIAAQQLIEKIFGDLLKPSASNTTGTLGGLLSSIGGFAKGDFLSPKDGGKLAVVAEGGYPEAVLTTDPKYASRQFQILKAYLRETKGLFGRIPKFAAGDFVSARQTEMDLLSSIQRAPSMMSAIPEAALANAGGGTTELRLRQILTTSNLVKDYMTSAEGEQVILTTLDKNANRISRISNRRRN